MLFLCKFGQNLPIGSLDRLQKKLIASVLIVWWPWKIGQGHQNIIKSFNYPNDTINEAGLNPSFVSRDREQKRFFFIKIWHSKCWCDLENKTNVIKIYSILSLIPMVFLYKFDQNPPMVRKKNRVQTRLIPTVLIVWWPWKLGQGHQNLIKSFNYLNNTIYKVWPEFIILFKRQAFLVKIWHSKSWHDLENEVNVTKI